MFTVFLIVVKSCCYEPCAVILGAVNNLKSEDFLVL